MKRALIALVAVGFVVAAITIARANSGAQDKPETNASPSRHFDRDLTTEQIKEQSEQLLRARAEIAKRVAEHAKYGPHTLVVTIREETPGDVWVIGNITGEPACVTPTKKVPTYLEVTAGDAGPHLETKTAPLEAKLLKSGACEASLKVFVPQQKQYTITIAGAGHGKFDPVHVQGSDQPQNVTVAG